MTGLLNAYALVIGIANYHFCGQLRKEVVNDAKDIDALLVDPYTCGYQRDNVTLLIDGQATRKKIVEAFCNLKEKCDKESTVFVYFSGHGGRIEKGSYRGEYLLPVDAKYQLQDLIPTNFLSSTTVSQLLEELPARKIVVFLDCCYAEGIASLKDVGSPLKAGLTEYGYEQLIAGRGRVVMASSRGDETSAIPTTFNNSLFTHFLLEGLRGKVRSKDEMIRVFDLFEYIQPKVTGHRPQQHPVFKSSIEENFALAFYLGGQTKSGGVTSAQEESETPYDVYISYIDRDRDAQWVWSVLVPKLQTANIKVVVSTDAEQPGVGRVVNIERGLLMAKRTLIVLSPAYLRDVSATFATDMAQTIGLDEGRWRLLPVKIAPIEKDLLPQRISMLTISDLTRDEQHQEREFAKIIRALQSPPPTM